MALPPKIDIDGASASAYIPWAKRLLAAARMMLPFGVRRFLIPAGVEVTIWWGGLRDRIKITAQQTLLAFGVHPDTSVGLVTHYSAANIPPTLVRSETAPIRIWSRDGHTGIDTSPASETHIYRDGVDKLTLARTGAFMNGALQFEYSANNAGTRASGQVSDNGHVVVTPHAALPNASTGSPGSVTIAKFGVYRPLTGTYVEIDPGVPDFSDLATGTISSYDATRHVFYTDVTSRKHAGTLRLRTRVTPLTGLYLNPYDATEIYVGIKALVIVSNTQVDGANARAWQLTLRPVHALYRYRLTTDVDGLYQAGSWTRVSSTSGTDQPRTIVDRAWAFGAESDSDVSTTVTVDGVLTCFVDLVNPFSSPGLIGPIDLVEPWFRLDKSMEPATHESVGTTSRSDTNPYTLEDSPLTQIIRYGYTSYALAATKRLLLSGVEYATGLSNPSDNIAGESLVALVHLGLGKRALWTTVAGSYKWLQPDGSQVTLTGPKVSKNADRAITATNLYVDGVSVLANPYGVLWTSFTDNDRYVASTAFDTRRVIRLANSGGWALTLEEYILTSVSGVVTLFDDLIPQQPAITQPTIFPS